MFQRFFSGENLFFQMTSKVFDLVLLSTLWAVLCLPVVTIGPATSALYFTAVKCLRGDEPGLLTHFFRSFRTNFKVGALATLLLTALWAVLLWWYLWLSVTAGGLVLQAYTFLLLVPLGMTCFALATLGRFTFGVRDLLKTALRLTLGHLPSALGAAAVTWGAAVLTALLWLPVMFAPALTALVWSLLFERVYAPFLPPAQGRREEESEEERHEDA